MKKAAVLVCMASVLLSGCSVAGGEKVSQTADSCAQAVASELAKIALFFLSHTNLPFLIMSVLKFTPSFYQKAPT